MTPLYALVLFLVYFGSEFCCAMYTITPNQFLKDPESIVSNNSIFRLGFFTPPNTTNRYVGIWYNRPSILEVVWVANKNNPLTDSTGVVIISDDGNLQVSNAKNEILWSSNISTPGLTNSFSAAQLQNSGNLVLQVNETIIWQSFQHPTDSFLPTMELTLRKNSGMTHLLYSWRSPSDPSKGRFSAGGDTSNLHQIIVFEGDRPCWRGGPWNGHIYVGTRYTSLGYGRYQIIPKEDDGGDTHVFFNGVNESLLLHYELSYQGILAQKLWDDVNKKWRITWKAPEIECDKYGKCGEFGICNPDASPICSCLKGFEPKNKQEWKRGIWTNGCVRKTQLQCGVQGGKQDGFFRLQNIKVPDNYEWKQELNAYQCKSRCFSNCSCLAYAYDVGDIKCLMWSTSLIDIATLSPGGMDLHLKLPQSELGNNRTELKVVTAVSGTLGLAAAAAIIFLLWKCRARSKAILPLQSYIRSPFSTRNNIKKNAIQEKHLFKHKAQGISESFQQLTFKRLAKATNDFHKDNMLGAGGFGKVYKGKLEDGQEIAVKRLSRASGQGIQEFMNEVAVISKLQHRNLVKLLGCCAEGEEKMLIYEYMPNKSLDALLFDPVKCGLPDWEKRFNIIKGICRGLVYLHRDSRLRIIHRDLKASNILLDEDLIPKISDFGMAKIFRGTQDQANTERVVGTYGYMSPEYAMEGQVSEKLDVFSFGVMLIEIVSGKKNNSFWYEEESLSLLGYAWKLWNEENIRSLIDPQILSTRVEWEIVRCMHVGLLCVQQLAKDRPSISTVMSMLVSEIVDLPQPKQPGFTQRQLDPANVGVGSPPVVDQNFSPNYVTISSLTARQ